ncbi:hypothetical protein M9H77_22741 [Catharanthus roseus]|uniref:Uncharacterized protein n=1 Tax=Catharanthus roseus TaxID=4058 RepID=A0ACC0AR21_CATRO|nr:hypothetical protein M9H77_22741 [Catharanthus roseus]
MTRLFSEAKCFWVGGYSSGLNAAYSPSAWIITGLSFGQGVVASYLGPFGFNTYSQFCSCPSSGQSQPPSGSPVSMLNLARTPQASRSAFSLSKAKAGTARTVFVLDDDDDANEQRTNEEANHQGIDGGTGNSDSGQGDAAKCDSSKGMKV